MSVACSVYRECFWSSIEECAFRIYGLICAFHVDVLGLCRLHFTKSGAFNRSNVDLVDITLLEMHYEVVDVAQI